MKSIFYILAIALFCSFEETEPLKMADIHKVMSDVLSKNVEQKEITAALLKQAFVNYIETADPFAIYLLEAEVKPWVNMDEFELLQVVAAYKKGDYSKFTDLNDLISNAMKRAEGFRQKEYERSYLLFDESEKELPHSFAKNLDQLKERQKENIIQYIFLQRKKYGNKKVMEKQQAVLKNYENKMRSFEADYLFVDSHGKPLSSQQRESLFALHILKALTKAIDTHTSYMTSTEVFDMKVRLEKEYTGTGVTFKEGIDGIYVDKVMPHSSAAKDGRIAPEDKLLAIDKESIDSLTLKDVHEKLDLDANKKIDLTLDKKGEVYDAVLTRAPVTMTEDRVDVQYEPFSNGIIGTIKLDSFYDNNEGIASDKDIREAIHHLEGIGNLKGLILDLRENHGGFVTQGVKVAGLFITNGVIMISRYNNGEEKYYRDIDGHIAFDGPLIILTSRETASAAEITTQALQDYGVALVVGDDHTYGKGSIQSQTVTDNQGANHFKVTVGKYYTVSGKTPDKRGVQADIVVPGKYMEEGIEGDVNPRAKPDQIPSAFTDNLKDVPEQARPWFLHYYTPTLQHPTDFWKKWIPFLQKNSAYRIDNNKNYQFFLKKSTPEEDKEETVEEEAILNKGGKNAGVVDLQLQEAKNILKDMIQIEQTQGLKSARRN